MGGAQLLGRVGLEDENEARQRFRGGEWPDSAF